MEKYDGTEFTMLEFSCMRTENIRKNARSTNGTGNRIHSLPNEMAKQTHLLSSIGISFIRATKDCVKQVLLKKYS